MHVTIRTLTQILVGKHFEEVPHWNSLYLILQPENCFLKVYSYLGALHNFLPGASTLFLKRSIRNEKPSTFIKCLRILCVSIKQNTTDVFGFLIPLHNLPHLSLLTNPDTHTHNSYTLFCVIISDTSVSNKAHSSQIIVITSISGMLRITHPQSNFYSLGILSLIKFLFGLIKGGEPGELLSKMAHALDMH